MKRVKIAVPLILAFILITSGSSIFLLKNTEKHANSFILKVEQAVSEENYSACISLLTEFREFWSKRETLYLLFVRHEEMHSIEIGIEQMLGFAQCRDKSAILGELYMMRATLSHISVSELPLIENIL